MRSFESFRFIIFNVRGRESIPVITSRFLNQITQKRAINHRSMLTDRRHYLRSGTRAPNTRKQCNCIGIRCTRIRIGRIQLSYVVHLKPLFFPLFFRLTKLSECSQQPLARSVRRQSLNQKTLLYYFLLFVVTSEFFLPNLRVSRIARKTAFKRFLNKRELQKSA